MKRLILILAVLVATLASCEPKDSIEPKETKDSVYIYCVDDEYYL